MKNKVWQPIETAPRDGTWFVIFVDDEYEVGRYNPNLYDRYVEVSDGLYRREKETGYEWDGFDNFARATHWLPLSPPTEPPEKNCERTGRE
jgi:hypothetical protein